MNPDNNFSRKKRIIYFFLIFLATAGIEFFLIAMLWQKEENPLAKAEHTKILDVPPARYNILLGDNELLAIRFNALQELDQQYAALLTEPDSKDQLDSINQLIHAQEEIFRASIDSIFTNAPDKADNSFNKLFNNIVSSYRSILQNRNSISSLRNAIKLDKKNLSPDEMATLKIQNELEEKNDRIASLEGVLKVMTASQANAATHLPQAGASENITALKETATAQENKIAVLNEANNSLKQENERLIKQQGDIAKKDSPNEALLKTKTASLQQRVDELNAELRLARVDCNLSRVDAGQIISNSRQRQELLSEASGILTSLSNSEDAVIKKKVQDKITRLNQVAANSRD